MTVSPLRSQRRITLAILAVLTCLLATSCGTTAASDSASATTAPTTGNAQDAPTSTASELTTVRVAARNSISSSPLWIADSQGFFQAEGLSIEFVPVASEREVLSSLFSGEADFGITSSAAVIRGMSADLEALRPEVYIDGTANGGDARGSLSLVTPEGSAITSGCDLENAVVSIDSVTSVAAVAVKEMVFRDGCDPGKLRLEVTPDAEVAGALLGGDLDAAAATDPLTAQLLRDENVVAVNLDQELCAGFDGCPLSVAVARTLWSDAQPETVASFRSAMHQSMQWSRTNDVRYRAELIRCCGIHDGDAAEIVVPRFVGEQRDLATDITNLRSVIDAQVQRERLQDEAEAAAIDADADDAAADEDQG